MAEITQNISTVQEYSVTPSRNNPSTFFEDRETRLQEEATRIPQQNTQAKEINSFSTQANALRVEVNQNATEVANIKALIDQKYIDPAQSYNPATIDAKDSLIVKASFRKSGYTTDILPEDRWTESNDPNCIYDTKMDSYIIDGVVYNLADLAEEF